MLSQNRFSKTFYYFALLSFILLLVVSVLVIQFNGRMAIKQALKLSETNHLAIMHMIKPHLLTYLDRILKARADKNLTVAMLRKQAGHIYPILKNQTNGFPVLTIKLYDMQGILIASSVLDEVGEKINNDALFQSAKDGEIVSEIQLKNVDIKIQKTTTDLNVLTSFMPLTEQDAPTQSVLAMQSNITGAVQNVQTFQKQIQITVSIIAGSLYLLMLLCMLFIEKSLTASTESIRGVAIRDAVTGLPNRRSFVNELAHVLDRTRQSKTLAALILIDLDYFKQINGLFGYDMGDVLLSKVAERLNQIVNENESVSRLSGDEFAVLAENLQHKEEVNQIVERISNGVNDVFELNNRTVTLTASMGIAIFPTDSDSLNDLLEIADKAKDSAKNQGRNSYVFYSKDMNKNIQESIYDEKRLKLALKSNEFKLHYQPKVDATTAVIKGMEALLRWQHPEHGIVSPVEFIPLLEQTGLIIDVGLWALKEACYANKRWQDLGLPPIKVAVNVSLDQFKNKMFADTVKQVLNESKLAPCYLEIELTESCIMDDMQEIIDILNSLKELGVSISIDDFGTGYSSLNYLKKLPIDVLKIDRSFVANVDKRDQNDNAAIVTAIMALSHSLRLDVVAEGVETAQELAYLHALGCQTIQGFLFSRPLTEDEFTKLLQDSVSLQDTIQSVRTELGGGRG